MVSQWLFQHLNLFFFFVLQTTFQSCTQIPAQKPTTTTTWIMRSTNHCDGQLNVSFGFGGYCNASKSPKDATKMSLPNRLSSAEDIYL